jgi:hypothetical protein
LDSVSYKLIARNAIGIDYMAWKRGFLTVNEVKAAMIWKPLYVMGLNKKNDS